MGLAFDRKVVENLRYTVARASCASTERTNLTAFSLVKIEEDIFFGILALIDTGTATASLDVANTSVKSIIDICASEDVFDTHSLSLLMVKIELHVLVVFLGDMFTERVVSTRHYQNEDS